jgi:radical SAM superfamily enzyme YgiQ (UPF0313 family)
MDVCLVAAPTGSEIEDECLGQNAGLSVMASQVPLGILSLAAVLEGRGIHTEVVDLDLSFSKSSWPGDANYRQGDFYSFALGRLADLRFDVIGFSTMCDSYPLTLRLAKGIRRIHPKRYIILGGPQATVVDSGTLGAFPFVDVIVRGEAEATLPLLLEVLDGRRDLAPIPGITYRDHAAIVRNPNAPVIEDLDSLPLPAYHLLPCNPALHGKLPLELGRGCPFACSFCATNNFFRRRFRLKSPARLIDQMSLLHQIYSIDAFDLIHDMFTVDRRRVVEFCNALLRSGHNFKWACSARSDCVDDALLSIMFEAGCTGIFFGIETGSPRMQRIIGKNLDLAEARRVIAFADAKGIGTTVSTIVGYPEEEKEDLALTVSFVVDALRHESADPQINILAPLAKTPLLLKNRDKLLFDGYYSDMSFQGWRQDPADKELILGYPDIFPNFYGLPCRSERGYLLELGRFFMAGERRFRWLLIALHQETGHLLTVFEAWRAWRQEPGNPAKYYESIEFSRDFQAFLKAVYLGKMNPESLAVRGLLELQGALEAKSHSDAVCPNKFEPEEGAITPELIPCRVAGVRVVRVGTDVGAIIEALRSKQPLPRVVQSPKVLAATRFEDDQLRLMELPPLLADALHLCQGQVTVREIVKRFSRTHRDVDGIPAAQVCRVALAALRQNKLVGFRRPPSNPIAAADHRFGHQPVRAGA